MYLATWYLSDSQRGFVIDECFNVLGAVKPRRPVREHPYQRWRWVEREPGDGVIFIWPWNEIAQTKQKQQINGNRVGFGWLLTWTLGWKNFMPEELSRNQMTRHFDVLLQHNWPIEQCLLHKNPNIIRVFFGWKTRSPCFHLSIHWLIKQIMNTYLNHFLRSYENRSNIVWYFYFWGK